MLQQLPFNTKLKAGVFKNGLTYLIMPNARPEGMADFYIVYNIGAIEDEAHQNGLAHFLEHMAFNGAESSIYLQ